MTGRNSKPKKRGPAAAPTRLEQFGESLAEGTEPKAMKRK
ncbi:hypothetical protein PASE110613_04875 [Paenibacillus sediminis]|uniref:YfhD family protein n=1 Tax=Paenibacillus sediminis TaxID=664909 RepID=A0ABS4H0Q3_9BACL|nr:hypothetical protein [Paenibacillus sediminis]